MRKGIIFFICFVILTLICVFTYFHYNKFSSAEQTRLPALNSAKDSILTISIIGDSWATGKQVDSILSRSLLEKNISSRIFSSGHGGATTKQVYLNLFKDRLEPNSLRPVIELRPNYCIVLVGVNDAALHYGGRFYSYHLKLIIKALLDVKITPVIISMPEFGINETTRNVRPLGKIRNHLSSFLNRDVDTDCISSYRKQLLKDLKKEKLLKKIVYVDFDNVIKDYSLNTQLYENPSHLSKKGFEKLGTVLAKEILSDWSTQLLSK